jgi:hypothetical protein
VRHNGRLANTFDDERGRVKHLRRNEAATTIYHNDWMRRHPGAKAACRG